MYNQDYKWTDNFSWVLFVIFMYVQPNKCYELLLFSLCQITETLVRNKF